MNEKRSKAVHFQQGSNVFCQSETEVRGEDRERLENRDVNAESKGKNSQNSSTATEKPGEPTVSIEPVTHHIPSVGK